MYLETIELPTQSAGEVDATSDLPGEGRCAHCSVRERAICAGLDDSGINALAAAGRTRRVAKGQVLAWQGEQASTVTTVRSGIVSLVATSSDGTEHIVGLVGAGGFVGQGSSSAMRFSLVALTDADLCLFPVQRFEVLTDRLPALQKGVVTKVAGDLERSRDWMVKLGRASAMERVAALMAQFADACPDDRLIPFPLTRGQMANFAGLTIETVSRQLTRLRDRGVIEIHRRTHFEVLDRRSLNSLADLSSDGGYATAN